MLLLALCWLWAAPAFAEPAPEPLAGPIAADREPETGGREFPPTAASASSSPRIELLTIAAGGYLYSYWGHAALRVFDPRDQSDEAYNFGGIDLEGGVLGWIASGQIRGFMYRTTFAEFLAQYSGEDRTITRRTLDLPGDGAERLAKALRGMADGPRAYYTYHHFRDNCSTRIAEALDQALDGRLRAALGAPIRGTFRSKTLAPIRSQTLLSVVFDVIGGPTVDVPLTAWDGAFLPEGLAAALDNVTLDGRKLVTDEQDIYRSLGFDPEVLWTWPWVKVYILLLAPLLLVSLFAPRVSLFAYALLTGVAGLLVLALWLRTPYEFFRGNWNLLILPPLHLALLPGLVTSSTAARQARWRALYLAAHALVLLGILGLFEAGVIHQAIGPTLGWALPATLLLLASERAPGLGITWKSAAS